MKKIAVLSAAALIGVGTLASTGAEARGRGGAIAAGVIGGLAAGALLGAATSGYGYGAPAYGYDDGYYGGGYRSAGYGYGGGYYGGGYRNVGYDDGYYAAPAYRTRRVVREVYDYPAGYGGYSWGGPSYGYYDY